MHQSLRAGFVKVSFIMTAICPTKVIPILSVNLSKMSYSTSKAYDLFNHGFYHIEQTLF